ncbi:MAG: hypothetical protein AB8B79_02820 [Granulosicoccus sp.]
MSEIEEYMLVVDRRGENGQSLDCFITVDGDQWSCDRIDAPVDIANGVTLRESVHSRLIAHDANINNWDLQQLVLRNGYFYPRIYRPYLTGTCSRMNRNWKPIDVIDEQYDPGMGSEPHPIDLNAYGGVLSQLVTLQLELISLFQVCEPSPCNMDVFGHRIRNLFLVAATEAEAQMKGVLVANSVDPLGRHYNTNDYVRLLGPMSLDQYEIMFPLHPCIASSRPFDNWHASQPTRSLTWYDAYNATKHDREFSFDRATLSNVISAVCACVVLLIAQYGRRPEWSRLTSGFFEIAEFPSWELSEMYKRNISTTHRSIDYPFDLQNV